MTSKPPNGQGESFALSVNFDPASDDDIRAYAVWQHFSAQKKGSAIIKGMLHFIADHADRTGVVLTPERIMGLFLDGQALMAGPPGAEPLERETPDIVVNATSGAVTAEAIAANLSASGGNLESLFGEDF